MKKLSKLTVLLFVFAALISTQAKAQIAKAEIIATGLTCSMCSNAIQKQLESMSEVMNVETDLNTNTFIVLLKEDNNLTPQVFKEKVEKAGFFIGSLVLTAKPEVIKEDRYVLLDGNLSNQGEIKFQVLDRGFVTAREYKKLAKSFKKVDTYTSNNQELFHIKIVNK